MQSYSASFSNDWGRQEERLKYVVNLIGLLISLTLGGPTSEVMAAPPLGFTILCIKQPNECVGGGASVVSATEETMDTLRGVNNRVNRSIAPRADGAADVWTVNARAGDCEDYVLAKRRALIRAGLPASALRIAFVRTRSGQDHAILIVNTDSGKLVLDNLTGAIKPLSQTRYRIVSVQTANPKQWT
jgi:predicted transglutaminase-like cysteine proteinase